MKFLAHLLAVLAVAPAALFAAPLEVRQESPQQTPYNIFEGKFQYVRKDYITQMARTAASFRAEGDEENALKTEKVSETASTFIWYASLNAMSYFEPALADARAVQEQKGQKVVVPFVVYNMPDRDCGSEASNGELTFERDGLNRYKAMVDSIAATVDKYSDLDYAIVIEPDSLANMVTNVGVNRCQPSLFENYIDAYAYVIQKFQKPNVGLYIDVAHSQWLGWPDNVIKVADVLERILERAGPDAKIRGYSQNVSNYQPFINPNPTTVNPNFDEYHYALALKAAAQERNLPAHFIIDTGRSGRPEALVDGVWCNLKDAGLGRLPSADTAPHEDLVDSWVWIKPPGDSDGASVPGRGYDTSCTGPNNFQPAPAPGQWFVEYSKMLIKNANPPVEL